MVDKEKIRPVYSELQGYLSQAPTALKSGDVTYDPQLWNQYNKSIDLLNGLTEENYDRFKIEPTVARTGHTFISIATYRGKLGGLISNLHGLFFSDEQPPFAGMPTTIISQNQQQSQSLQVQMLLEVQSKIDEKLHNFDKGSKERTFLEKVKSSLSSVRSISELLTLLLGLGKEFGIDIDKLADFFK